MFYLALTTVFSTALGGLVALKMRDRLYLIVGFTSGVLLGVVCFDLLPEIFEMVRAGAIDARAPMLALVGGFLFFHGAESLLLLHHAHEESFAVHRHPQVGLLSAGALVAHSCMDGVGIGLGFQVSASAGIAVAAAVIAHDFADGFNTVSLMLAHRNSPRRSIFMLGCDALAPLLGAASTLFFKLPPAVLAIYLGFFAGFLLHISTADILPEAHAAHRPTILTLGLTVLGAAFIFVVQSWMP